MSEAGVEKLVALLARVRGRSRSTWQTVVEHIPDDEAHGHEAFAALRPDDGDPAEDFGAEDVLESAPRLKVAASLLPPVSGGANGLETASPENGSFAIEADPAREAADDQVAHDGHDFEGEPPVLEVLADDPPAEGVAEARAEVAPALSRVSVGELVRASVALRPRADAW